MEDGDAAAMTEFQSWWRQAEAEGQHRSINKLAYHQFPGHEGGRGLRTLAPIPVRRHLFISF
jgi:hypothetical protein